MSTIDVTVNCFHAGLYRFKYRSIWVTQRPIPVQKASQLNIRMQRTAACITLSIVATHVRNLLVRVTALYLK